MEDEGIDRRAATASDWAAVYLLFTGLVCSFIGSKDVDSGYETPPLQLFGWFCIGAFVALIFFPRLFIMIRDTLRDTQSVLKAGFHTT